MSHLAPAATTHPEFAHDCADNRSSTVVENLILMHVPANGDAIGNKSCLRKIQRTHRTITEDDYWAAQRRLVAERVLFTPRGGNGGAICRYEARDRHRGVERTVSKKRDIQAVLLDTPHDPNPTFLGRAFLDWEKDPLHREASRYYSAISAQYHKTGLGPLLACQDCRHPILITGMNGQHKRTLKHRGGDQPPCPCRGQSVGNKAIANDEIHGDGPISDVHEQIVAEIRDALLEQFPSVASRSFEINERLASEDLPNPLLVWSLMNRKRVILDGIRLDMALRAPDGERYRRPDISFRLRHPDGREEVWAIEVQRSQMFTDDIVERTRHYRESGANLIWIVIDTLATTPTSRTALDFQDVHRGRLILFDEAALHATRATGSLHLTFAEYSTAVRAQRTPISTRTLRFPDQLTVLNHVVCDEDHRGDAAIARARTAREQLNQSLLPLGDHRNNNAAARENAELAIPLILEKAMDGYTEAADADQAVSIESEAFRSIMVMSTMLERMRWNDMRRNLTTSFFPKGPFILSMDHPQTLVHDQIVAAFAVTSGYEDFRQKHKGVPFFQADFEGARQQFHTLSTPDRRLYEVFLAEAFCPVTRYCLGEVGRLPAWARINPLTGTADCGVETRCNG